MAVKSRHIRMREKIFIRKLLKEINLFCMSTTHQRRLVCLLSAQGGVASLGARRATIGFRRSDRRHDDGRIERRRSISRKPEQTRDFELLELRQLRLCEA